MAHPSFRMPKRVKITGRSSSITNSFVQSLIPEVPPTGDDVLEALEVLHIDPERLICSYCGDPATEWDHLRPLVKDKMPTGFISEIGNLVPSCGKCNQSKGNKPWREWMLSSAKLSPKSRGVPDLDSRVACLEAFESWRRPDPVDLSAIVGQDLWSTYWAQRDTLLRMMQESQALAERIRATVLERLSVS